MAWCPFSLWLDSSNGPHSLSSIWMKIKPWIVKAKVSQHDFIYSFSYITKLKTLTLFLTENLIPRLRRLSTASPSKSLRKVKATRSINCVSQSTPDNGLRTTMTQSSYARMLLKSCESCISHNLAMSFSNFFKFSCLTYNLREGERLYLLDLMGREPQLGYSRHVGSSSQGNAYYWLTSINFYYCSHYPPSKLSISHTPWYF